MPRWCRPCANRCRRCFPADPASESQYDDQVIRVVAHLVKANAPPEAGTGWHHHDAEFHIVIMLKGWTKFMYEGKEHLVSAGDCVHQRPGIVHFLFDYSPDMEYLEVVGPANFSSIEDTGPCAVPPPTPW